MKFIRKIIKPPSKENEALCYELKLLLNFKPTNLSYYKKAFTHRSLKKIDEKGNPINYERLEFLGDAMLGAFVASYLHKKAPKGTEGYLTQMRSKIVSREHLNKLGKDLNLTRFVKTNISKNRIGNNIHGNILEALVGAIYLDKGYSYCEQFVYEKIIVPCADIGKLEGKVISYKKLIIEWCQKHRKEYLFDAYEDTGNQSIKHFSVKISVDGVILAKGRSISKKKAEEQAAKRVYYVLQNQIMNS